MKQLRRCRRCLQSMASLSRSTSNQWCSVITT